MLLSFLYLWIILLLHDYIHRIYPYFRINVVCRQQCTNPLNNTDHSIIIKQEAQRLQFDYCGISKAVPLDDDARRLEAWLNKGLHGKMKYMENHFEMRIDPSKLMPGARSVISLLYNYYQNDYSLDKTSPRISKYALGDDYHSIIRKKLYELLNSLQSKIGNINARVFVDSGPVLERAWAVKSGLGWIGKNGNLINKQHGSFYFLAEIITDLELKEDTPIKDYCGTCTRCVDACPTDALLPNKVVDGSKCISYFTIELRDEIPESYKDKFENWMFGCDICQDICPWNRFAKNHSDPQLSPADSLLAMEYGDWEELTEEIFQKLFRNSPLKRAKYNGIKRNLAFLGIGKPLLEDKA